MPIRINLLAEAMAEEDLRKNDPVKRGIVVGALLVAVFLVMFSSIWLESLLESKNMSQLDAEIQTRSNEYSNVLSNLKKIGDLQARLDALKKLNEARFLQGNFLEAFQKFYVPNVQMTRLKLDQTYVVSGGTKPVKNSHGTIPGKPATSTEQIVLTIDAKDLSPSAGDQVNRYKDALVDFDYFKKLLDRTNGVRLSNLSAPQTSIDGKPYVMFTLECRFLDVSR